MAATRTAMLTKVLGTVAVGLYLVVIAVIRGLQLAMFAVCYGVARIIVALF